MYIEVLGVMLFGQRGFTDKRKIYFDNIYNEDAENRME
jgi:hypothetical protein